MAKAWRGRTRTRVLSAALKRARGRGLRESQQSYHEVGLACAHRKLLKFVNELTYKLAYSEC